MWMEAQVAGAPNLSTRGSKSWAIEMHVVERRKNRRKKKSSKKARQRDLRQCTNQRRRQRNSQPPQVPGMVRSSVLTAGALFLCRVGRPATLFRLGTQIKSHPFELTIGKKRPTFARKFWRSLADCAIFRHIPPRAFG
jgi:hypothetical protein